MIKKFVSLLILVIMVSACASKGPRSVSVDDMEKGEGYIEGSESEASVTDAAEDKPMEALAFADLNMFDKELSKALKTNQDEVEVALISKFNTNDIPDRLGKWFYMVDKHDGKVEMQSNDPTKRGIPGIGSAISLAISATASRP